MTNGEIATQLENLARELRKSDAGPTLAKLQDALTQLIEGSSIVITPVVKVAPVAVV